MVYEHFSGVNRGCAADVFTEFWNCHIISFSFFPFLSRDEIFLRVVLPEEFAPLFSTVGSALLILPHPVLSIIHFDFNKFRYSHSYISPL